MKEFFFGRNNRRFTVLKYVLRKWFGMKLTQMKNIAFYALILGTHIHLQMPNWCEVVAIFLHFGHVWRQFQMENPLIYRAQLLFCDLLFEIQRIHTVCCWFTIVFTKIYLKKKNKVNAMNEVQLKFYCLFFNHFFLHIQCR